MDNEEKKQEEAILKSIADFTGFFLVDNTKYYKCKYCSKRFYVHYAGKSLTDRMLEHYKIHLARNY